ncbi:hypothetical protein [Pectobacterium peruviense]|uniref:hypothetical protein n=1 Tax=Pectobacterium peruviense TaxID=2066479 RepID=UPI000DE2EE88|nr:hypothetical protein [Pectobacterium peruviense]
MIDYHYELNDIREYIHKLSIGRVEYIDKISAPFIPDLSDSFKLDGSNVVLIGQETNGWHGNLFNAISDEEKIDKIICNSKSSHKKLLSQGKVDSSFLRYIHKIKESNNGELVQWLNFYLCDYKKSSFFNLKGKNNDLYEFITKKSVSILSRQLNKLKPKVIFFAGKYHNNFPLLEDAMNLTSREKLTSKNKKISLMLWNGETLVIRIPHPGSWSKVSRQARLDAIDYMKLFNSLNDVEQFKKITQVPSICHV